ncbi:MAG: RluA family pseudouridine synthase, partial [Erysipelotrichia bacterium]|nr:RluA family pseudouridine synthase [Erysipelotrichia bacterium]
YNDEVKIYATETQFQDFTKQKNFVANDKIKNWIIYEDDQIILVNKPRGMLVQKSTSRDESLDQLVAEYLIYTGTYDPENELAFKPGPAHRLDRNTSGIVAFGKTHKALRLLFQLFKGQDLIDKHYLVLVVGNVEKDKGLINAPLKKDNATNSVTVATVEQGAKTAKTTYKVLKRLTDYTLLDVTLLTGRTHQIRVHLAHINHPIVGDPKYGDLANNRLFKQQFGLAHQFLHAYKIGFGDLPTPLVHLSGQQFTAPIKERLLNILEQLNIGKEGLYL